MKCNCCFRYQSGFTPPGDIKFEDLSKMDPESASPSEISSKVFNHHTLKNTISASRMKKRPGFFWIFNSNKVRGNYIYSLLMNRSFLRCNFFVLKNGSDELMQRYKRPWAQLKICTFDSTKCRFFQCFRFSIWKNKKNYQILFSNECWILSMKTEQFADRRCERGFQWSTAKSTTQKVDRQNSRNPTKNSVRNGRSRWPNENESRLRGKLSAGRSNDRRRPIKWVWA